jgi:hypothetical protein
LELRSHDDLAALCDAFSGLVSDEIRNSAQSRTFLELARLKAQNKLQ